MTTPKFIIDFDSTFVSVEALDELSKICLANEPKRNEIVRKIEDITKLGMEGKITFSESLSQRLSLFHPTKRDIRELINLLKKKITASFKRNKYFFQRYTGHIYIISGGFKEWIIPVVKDYRIPQDFILANEFIFNNSNEIIGYDCKNPLSQEKGKVKQVKNLNLQGNVYVLGDGFTDYEIRQAGLATRFMAFTENVRRPEIVEKADGEIKSFDEFLKLYSDL